MMNSRRFFHGFLAGMATLLGVCGVLLILYTVSLAGSEVPPQPTPGFSEMNLGGTTEIQVLKSTNLSQTGDAGSAEDYMYSTLPVPDGLFFENLSPPDAPVPSASPAEPESVLTSYNAHIRIAGSTVKPRSSDVEWAVTGNGGCTYATSGSLYTWWNAPVLLPQNSTIKYFRFYGNDASAGHNSAGYLTVYDLYGDVVEEYGTYSSGATGENYWTTSEMTVTVDYESYSYVANWRPNELGDNITLCGFRIYYATPPGPIFLPLVTK